MTPLEQLLLNNLRRASGGLPVGLPPVGGTPAGAMDIPPPPPGFTEDVGSAGGFDPMDPPGTGFSRAVERGATNMAASVPSALALKDSTVARDMIDPTAILADVLSQTSLGAVPPGLDLSSPDAAFAGLSQMGYPPQMVQALRDVYDIRVRDMQAAGADVNAVYARGAQNEMEAQRLLGEARALPFSPGAAEYQAELEAAPDTVAGMLGTILSNPVGAATFIGETAAESTVPMGAGLAATVAGGPLAGGAVLGAGTMAQEFGTSVDEFLREKGIVLRTPEDAKALLANNELMQEAGARGIGRAYVVTLSELAGLGLAGDLTKSATKNALLGVGGQMVTGGAGEYLARAATGQEQSAKEVMLEGLAEAIGGPVEVAPAIVQDVRAKAAERRANAADPNRLGLPAEVPPPPPGFTEDVTSGTDLPDVNLPSVPTGPWNPVASAPASAPAPAPTSEQVPPPPPPVDVPPVEVPPAVAPAPASAQPDPNANLSVGNPPMQGETPAPEQTQTTVNTPAVSTVAPAPEAPKPLSLAEADAAHKEAWAKYDAARREFNAGRMGVDEFMAIKAEHDAALAAWEEAFKRQGEKIEAVKAKQQKPTVAAPVAAPTSAPAPVTPPVAAAETEPAPEPDPNAVDQLGNPLNPKMGGIVGGDEKTRAEQRAAAASGRDLRTGLMPATTTPAPAAEPTYAPTNATGKPSLTPRGVTPAVSTPKEPTRFGAKPNSKAAQLQAELDDLVAELDARREAAVRQKAEKPADTQDRFNREMDEIAAFVESRAKALGVKPEDLPTLDYALNRESGTTRYKVSFARKKVDTYVGKGRNRTLEKQYEPESPFQIWRGQMNRSRTAPGATYGTGANGARPSVGPRQRFADAVDAAPDAGQDAAMSDEEQARAALDEVDGALPPDAERAVSDFIGHEAGKKNKSVDLTNAFGVMFAQPLEDAVRNPDSPIAQAIERVFAPVREKLRAIYGDTVRLYRVQRPVGRGQGSAPADGQRAVLSWTLDPTFADEYSGAGKDADLFTDEQIEAVVAEYEATGAAKIPGTRYRFVNETAEDMGIGLYERGEYVTGFYDDVQEIRDYMRDLNNERTAFNARNAEARGQIVAADVPLDDVIFATDRANQMEFLVRNDPDADHYIGPDGQQKPKAAPAQERQRGPWDRAEDQAEDSGVRVPRGGFTPNMNRVSFAEAGPISEAAFRDAGLDPDRANNLPPVQQRNILVRLLKDRFGIDVDVKGDLNMREAIDQLLDAYRGLRAMAAVLHLHPSALSLDGRLKITMEKFKGRYLGAYSPANTTIYMPGRSNSFAHEWGHALDHFLRDLIPTATQSFDVLLTHVTRNEGLDPKDRLQGAFINLVYRMFFDEAAVAAEMLALEQTAQKTDKQGNPTKAALDAQIRLDRLRAGATRIRIAPTAYRSDSMAFSPRQSGYYGSVHEMLARAFEAYVGHKLANEGLVAQNFVTKGDAAYLSDADARLRMTFPKLAERVAIFKAFDDLFDAIRAGTPLGAGAPENFAETDIVDPAKWQKLYLAQTNPDAGLMGALKKEFAVYRNALADPVKGLRATVSETALGLGLNKTTPENLKALGRAALWVINSQRGIIKFVIARQPKAVQKHLRWLAGQVMTDPGTGSEFQQGENYEEQVERSATRTGSVIDKLLRVNNMKRGAIRGALDADANDRIRQIMLDGDVAGASDEEHAVASGLRRLINDAYRYGLKAGLDMGFIRDKGYLPRIILSERVEENGQQFVEQATKVYRIHYDRFMATMQDKELNAFASALSAKWRSRRTNPGAAPFDGEAAVFKKAASDLRRAENAVLAAQQDVQKNPGDKAKQAALVKARAERDRARAAYNQARADVVAAMREDYAEISAEAWRDNIVAGDGMQFDTLGPAQSYKDKRVLPGEADDLLADFYETDVIQLTMNYVHGVTKQAAYRTRLGTTSEENNDVRQITLRDEVAAAIRANPRKYDVETADGQFNIITQLADPTRDNLKEMLLRSAEQFGASSEALGQMRASIESITGRVSRGKSSRQLDTVVSAVYAMGTIVALPRAMWTMLTEPLAFMLRTGDVKNSGRVMQAYLREAVRSAKDVQELEALAEMVGVVASPLHDALMLNRMADGATVDSSTALLSRFFRANWMAQLTNAQRRSVLAGGSYMLRDMAAKWNKADASTPKGRADRKIIEADLRDLGVSNEQMEGFIQWLASGTGLPSLDDLQTPEGKVYTAAIARFVDTTIMNPRRADKPSLSLTPFGRLVFGLTSFIYAFTRHVHYATALRTGRNMEIRKGEGLAAMGFWDGVDDLGARLGVGFFLMLSGQMIVGAVRAFLFDSDQWQEKLDEDEEDDHALYWWLGKLAFSRTGALGGLDVIQQSVTGLRYERDLTSLTSGAYPSIFLGSIQKMAGVLSERNSPNTDTAENAATKAAYQFFLAPLASALLSAVPVAGPGASFMRNAALQYSTSNNAAQSFADLFFTKGNRT